MSKTKRETHLKIERRDTIKLVVKSNDLVEAKYMFNTWETRFFHILVSMINKNDDEDMVYRVWFKEIKDFFDIKSNKSYELLREAAKSLNRKSVYIGWMSDKYLRGREYNLFEFVDYLEEGQTGEDVNNQEYVDVKIQERMRPFLLHVKKNFNPENTRYTSYDMRNTQKLMPYATRIYELMKQFEYKGFRTIEVEDLKNMFLITEEYPKFSTFNQSVIVPSIKAINKYTDLYIDPKEITRVKKGRAVIALSFQIEKKTKEEINKIQGENSEPFVYLEEEEVTIKPNIVEQSEADLLFGEFETIVVRSFGVTPTTFLKMLNIGKYTKAELEQAINITRRAKFNQEITKNIAGFFLKALKDGYTDTKEELEKTKRERDQKAQKIQEELDLLRDEFSQTINIKIRQLTSQNEEVTQKAIYAINDNPLTKAMIRNKEKSFGRPLELEDYRKDEHLRTMVINSIVQTQQKYFEDILIEYNPKIAQLEKELLEL
jgi:plasmid replication initiation protein